MTLSEIVQSSLDQMGRATDAQTVAAWKRQYTTYANEALREIANTIRLRRTDTVQAAGGLLELGQLPRQVAKVLSLRQGGRQLEIRRGPDGTTLSVPDGQTEVTYAYYPAELSSDTDEPDIPQPLHHLIPLYVVARDHAGANVDTQGRSSLHFQLYRSGLAAARKHYGEEENYRIIHKAVW